MAWLSVPTIFNRTGGTAVRGYLAGIGPDDGFYCFNKGTPAVPEWIVSDRLDPIVTVAGRGGAHQLASYTYGGLPVWARRGGEGTDVSFVFWSQSQSAWIWMEELREPVLWPLLQGETEADRVGDEWLVLEHFAPRSTGSGPAYARGTAAAGSAWSQDCGLEYRKFVSDADSDTAGQPFGRYLHDETGDYRVVGCPLLSLSGSWPWSVPDEFRGEVFALDEGSPAAPSDRRTFTGSRGHSIRYGVRYGGATGWIIGDMGANMWLEGDDIPDVMNRRTASFEICTPDGPGTTLLRLAYAGVDVTTAAERILLAEVEQWR